MIADELPEGWEVEPVGSIFKLCGGGTPYMGDPRNWGGSIPWLSSGDVKTERIVGATKCITQEGLDSSSAKLCKAGAVILVVRSGILKHTLPVAILEIPAAINQDIRALESGNLEVNEWLALTLRAFSPAILEQNREGTTVQSVKTETIQNFPLPLPPLAEQRRIVAAVERILGKVSAACARLERVPTTLKRFRQAVLAAACSGRLTADWREQHTGHESANDLLRTLAKQRGIPAPRDIEGDVPEKWTVAKIGYLTELNPRGRPIITSGSRGWAKLVGTVGHFFIRSENINTDYLRLDGAVKVDVPEGSEAERTRVHAGDLLLTITGNNVGRTAVVSNGCPVAHVSQHVAIIRIVNSVNVNYVWLWLRSEQHGKSGLEHYGETKPGLNLEQIREHAINLPPRAEQQEIVQRVSALFARADAVEARASAALKRVESLTQAVLAKAFRGELVPTEAELARRENRPYESAGELLERIRASATDPPKPSRARKPKASL